MWEAPPLHKLEEAIDSPSNPIGMRMRAAYFLRQAYETAVRNHSTEEEEEEEIQKATSTTSIDDELSDQQQQHQQQSSGRTSTIEEIVIATLEKGLMDERHGSLLRHEFAYVMGQLRDERCCEALEQALSNITDCIMVRHECGEALGAIGAPRSIPILQEAVRLSPNTPEIGQTCEIAIEYMHWKQRNNDSSNNTNGANTNDEDAPMVCACMASPYSSIDPAPPHPSHTHLPTEQIGAILTNQTLPLFERYRAMFSLRNRGGSDAVHHLGLTLTTDTSSTLLRHEVAYVLGQMQHVDSVEPLSESLRREGEHAMVRHESAEALGAIEGRWGEVEGILGEFLGDGDVVVRDSCFVALDAADYWGREKEEGKEGGGVEGKEEEETAPVSPVGPGLEDEAVLTPLTFVQQKAVTNGRSTNQVLNHHFNVAC